MQLRLRSLHDLYRLLYLGPSEASRGGTFSIDTLLDGPRDIIIPPGTLDGHALRLRKFDVMEARRQTPQRRRPGRPPDPRAHPRLTSPVKPLRQHHTHTARMNLRHRRSRQQAAASRHFAHSTSSIKI